MLPTVNAHRFNISDLIQVKHNHIYHLNWIGTIHTKGNVASPGYWVRMHWTANGNYIKGKPLVWVNDEDVETDIHWP